MPGLPFIHPQQGELTTGPSDINALPPTSINAPQQSYVGGADQIASAIVQATTHYRHHLCLCAGCGTGGVFLHQIAKPPRQ